MTVQSPAHSRIQQRTTEIGLELFERAREALPRPWRRAWWEKRMLDYFAARPRMQAQAFRFMEALPRLHSDEEIARHLKEYLDRDDLELPPPARIAFAWDDPTGIFARSIGRTVRRAAFSMGTMFITGTNTREAIENAERLRRKNMTFTLDVLGEATISEAQADRAAAVYLELIESLGAAAQSWRHQPLLDESSQGPMPRANISLKLTAFVPSFDPVRPKVTIDAVFGRLRPLLRRARELGVFVNIDLEQFRYRDLTFEAFRQIFGAGEFRDWADVGVVVQAYLQDGERDYRRLLDWVDQRGTGIAVRLVKGAYWDSETTHAVRQHRPVPVWTRKWQSDANYERITRLMLENAHRIRPAFASHNVRSLAHVMAAAETYGLGTDDYELQMLAGMGDPLKEAIVSMGRCLRIYCPYGDLIQGMAYLIRRLLENTSNDSFLQQGFEDRGRYMKLLADPTIARPPSTPLPHRHYTNPHDDLDAMEFENAVNTSFASAENRKQLEQTLGELRESFAHGDHGKPRQIPLLIGGKPTETDAWLESRNPAWKDEIIARVAQATRAHADQAVAAAHQAFAAWSQESASERADVMRRTAELLEEQRFDFVAMLVLEAGKPWDQADGEVSEAIDFCRFHADQIEALARRPRRRNVPGEDNILIYEPCGVAVIICSWDFPLSLLAAMTTAAVASGNTCVVKPSSRTPVIGAKFLELMLEARLPAGVVNYVPGPGVEIGAHLAEHPDVHIVALCGSRETGLTVAQAASRVRPNQRHFKRLLIEGGAKNAIIVDSDVDVDEAVMGVLESAFAFGGQKCTACSRAIVLPAVYEEFCSKLAAAADTLVIGDPSEAGTFIGPVVDDSSLERIRGCIETGKKTARLIYEAPAGRLPRGGHYVPPTVFADVAPKDPLAREEIFGPVLAVIPADDFEHALEIANDSDYALTGGLYSRSPAHIERARWAFRVGNLYINRKITGSQVDVQPYGGGRLSGDGARLGGPDYMLQFTRPRTISENTLRHGLASTNEPEEELAGH